MTAAVISLSWEEQAAGVMVGARRLVHSQAKGLKPAAGAVRSWADEIEGALAEMALARYLGLYFDPNVGKYREKDVGPYHVRQTAREDGCLILRPQDPPGAYVLVVGALGSYRVAGWMDADDIRARPDYLRSPAGRPAAFFVPQSDLNELKPGGFYG